MRRVHLFLDNASSTNKNCFTMAWAMEMIQQGKLDFIHVSFMIPGHAKCVPDLLFSKISKTYNKSDVFTTEELQKVTFLMPKLLLMMVVLCQTGEISYQNTPNFRVFVASMTSCL